MQGSIFKPNYFWSDSILSFIIIYMKPLGMNIPGWKLGIFFSRSNQYKTTLTTIEHSENILKSKTSIEQYLCGITACMHRVIYWLRRGSRSHVIGLATSEAEEKARVNSINQISCLQRQWHFVDNFLISVTIWYVRIDSLNFSITVKKYGLSHQFILLGHLGQPSTIVSVVSNSGWITQVPHEMNSVTS